MEGVTIALIISIILNLFLLYKYMIVAIALGSKLEKAKKS
jgi:hypothetical protein